MPIRSKRDDAEESFIVRDIVKLTSDLLFEEMMRS